MTILNRETLELIMVGATHVIDMGGKEAHIFYETAERAHMALPDGKRSHGRWRLTAEGYTVDWDDGRQGVWSLDHTPGNIDYVDAGGVGRGRLARIEFGDSAGIAV
jgi:hypothetical protein